MWEVGQGWNQCLAEVQCQEPGVNVAGRAGRMENPEQRPELLASGLALLWPSWELLLSHLSRPTCTSSQTLVCTGVTWGSW